MKDWIYQPRPTLRWTDEDLDRLREMWAEDLEVDEIAEKLGRTPVAITVRASMLGLPRRAKGLGESKWAPSGMPASLRYQDDPRAAGEFDPLPAAFRGDVTAAMMGDPAPGRSAS